ncbi:MAG: hypothetical protein H6659_06485 [Ardenticatenaceae bacterium]|nr:hypothetical protein [Ardenticatenaceae bacterium]
MNAYFTSQVTQTTLLALLQASQDTWPWLYVETATDTELLWLQTALTETGWWHKSFHGRAFGPKSELAWWRVADDTYELRLLTVASPPLAKGVVWGEAIPWEPWGAAIWTQLYGELDTDRSQQSGISIWSEARIPRYLAYPLEEKTSTRVLLQTQAYARDGIVGLTRLLAVAGDPPAKEP